MIGYLRTLMLFYRRHLRVQPLRELMAVVGVSAGVALLFAVQVAHQSITGSFEQLASGVAGRATLELDARGPEGFDASIAEVVERMPGVRAAAPIFAQPIVAIGPRGRRALVLVGATEQVSALEGTLSRQFQRTGEDARRGLLVMTEPSAHAIGVAPGDPVAVQVGGRVERLKLDAAVPSSKIGPVAESPIAAAPLPVVQRLAHAPNRVTRVLIEPRAGRALAVRRALDERFGSTLNVRSVSAEASLLRGAIRPEEQVTLLFGAISLVVGVVLAYNALLLASDERRRFIAYLIEMGTPDAMIVASLAFDAFALGLAGSLLGLLGGDVLSALAFRTAPGYIAAAFTVGAQRVTTGQTIAIAFGGGMLAAFAAAVLPAAAALRGGTSAEPEAVGRMLSLARMLRPAERSVFALGASLVCLSIALSLLSTGTTVVALMGLAAGLVICLPLFLRVLLAVAQSACRYSRDPAARIAVAELRGSPARSVALLATGTVAAFLMVLIGGAVADVQHAVRRGASDVLSGAEVWIKPGGAENVYTTQPFASARTQRRLQQLDSVSSVLPWRDSFLDLPGRRVWVLGVPAQLGSQIAPSQLIEGSLSIADTRIRGGGWVAISATIARERHLHLGERFTLPVPTGFASVRLAATIANYGWLPGAIVMSGSEHARLWGNGDATQIGVTFKAGVSRALGKRAVERALAGNSALSVQTAEERRTEVSTVLGSTLSRLDDTTIVVLVATVASVIALMLAAISQHRERLDSLLAIGIGVGQLARLIFYEGAAVLLVGCLLGVAAGLLGQYLIDGWLQHTTGSPVTFTPAWLLGMRTIATAAGLSMLATVVAVIPAAQFHPRATLSVE